MDRRSFLLGTSSLVAVSALPVPVVAKQALAVDWAAKPDVTGVWEVYVNGSKWVFHYCKEYPNDGAVKIGRESLESRLAT